MSTSNFDLTDAVNAVAEELGPYLTHCSDGFPIEATLPHLLTEKDVARAAEAYGFAKADRADVTANEGG